MKNETTFQKKLSEHEIPVFTISIILQSLEFQFFLKSAYFEVAKKNMLFCLIAC